MYCTEAPSPPFFMARTAIMEGGLMYILVGETQNNGSFSLKTMVNTTPEICLSALKLYIILGRSEGVLCLRVSPGSVPAGQSQVAGVWRAGRRQDRARQLTQMQRSPQPIPATLKRKPSAYDPAPHARDDGSASCNPKCRSLQYLGLFRDEGILYRPREVSQ